MPIILTALVEALIYLASIPLCGAFILSTEGGLRFGVGVSAFDLGRALRHARRYRPVKARRGKTNANLSWQILRRLKGSRMRLQGRLGLGDAAATAVVCGALRSLGGARVAVDVTPEFSGDGLCLELQGMIRLRTGQIMSAIATNQIENIRRRIARWTNTRLKA